MKRRSREEWIAVGNLTSWFSILFVTRLLLTFYDPSRLLEISREVEQIGKKTALKKSLTWS